MRLVLKKALKQVVEWLRLNLVMSLAPLVLLVPCLASAQAAGQVTDRQVLAMGTELHLHLEGAHSVAGSEAALAECERIETACSTWNPESRWSRWNAAKGDPMPMPAEWLHLLGQMKAWSRRTEGAFDPVLMALMKAWRVREGGCEAAPEVVARALKASGSTLLALDIQAGTAQLQDPEAGVEEGGFLKGYALDRMRRHAKVKSGWIDFGGQILAWGRPHTVAVADPIHRDQPRLTLRLHNASLSSSGTSERGRHILDPRNGSRCPAWGATAVVSADALSADVLSTALYVMGPGAGLVWADRHQVAAAFLLNDGSLRMSRTFRALQAKAAEPET